MTGLEKITNQIIEEANNSANEKLKKAKEEAEGILSDAKNEAQSLCSDISRQSHAEIANYKDRISSSMDLKRRTALLEAKQALIAGTIDKAYEKFCQKDDAEYFKTILEMLDKFVLPEDGTIYFSPEDLKKIPSGFEAEIVKVAKAKGGSLVLSKEGRKMNKGFILAYGGIEENCSFEALFNSKRDELQDKVQKVLFS